MSIDVPLHIQSTYSDAASRMPVIKPREMKAILYLGIRGELAVASNERDEPDHTVDTYA